MSTAPQPNPTTDTAASENAFCASGSSPGTQTPTLDLEQAREFLTALTGSPNTPMTWQTFPDPEELKAVPGLTRILHGTLDEHAKTLAGLNAKGAGIFVTANQTNLKGRTKDDVVKVRAFFTDQDNPRTKPFSLQPSFMVHTSPGHYHAFWSVNDADLMVEGDGKIPLEDFTPTQTQLATYYGSDPKVKDLPRVVRVPGFFHRKREPVRVEFEPLTLARYTLDEVRLAHPTPETPIGETATTTTTGPGAFANAPTSTSAPNYDDVAATPARRGDVERARAYVDKMPPAIVKQGGGGGGHQATWNVALKLKGFNLSEGEALAELHRYNARCVPPWSDAELEHKIADAWAGRTPAGFIVDRDAPTYSASTSTGATNTEATGGTFPRPVRVADVLLEQYDQEAWIVPNLLAVGGLGIISADYGVGKSTLLTQFLACVSSGREFLGYPVTQAVECLYWQAEGSRRLFAGRVRDQCRNLGLDLNTLPLHFVPRAMDPLPFASPEFAGFVSQSGCRLVVCDTFGFFSDGDENSAKDWREKVAKPLKAISRATGISFVLVHHEGKPNEFRKGRHKIRGSSAMGGDCDTVLRLERVPDSPNGRLLAFDKVKETEEQSDLLLGFDKTTAIFTRESVAKAETPVPKEAKVAAKLAARDGADRKAKEDVALLFRRSAEGLTSAELEKAFHRGRIWMATTIGELHAAGSIRRDKAERPNARGQKRQVDVWRWS